MMNDKTNRLGRPFLTVWAGQTVSEIGTLLSGVAAAVYIFLETGSATWLGIASAVATLPAVLVGAAGSVIDRYPRRQVMIVGDVVAALSPLILLTLALTGNLQVGHLVAAGFIGSIGNAVQSAAAQAAIPALVDEDQLERAHALKQLGAAIGIVIGPVAATPILVRWGIEAVLIVDLVTFAIGVLAVGAVRFRDVAPTPEIDDNGSWRDMWTWLRGPGSVLIAMLALSATVNLTLAFFNVSILVATTVVGGAATAGMVLGVGGAAMIAGSIATAQLGASVDRAKRIAAALALVGIGIAVAGIRPSTWNQAIGIAMALSAVPMISATAGAIFNERVPTQMQGRVFALRGALANGLQSAGSLVAGVLVAKIAEPAMSTGVLRGSLGRVLGTGPSAGAALVLVGAGLVTIVIAAVVMRSSLRAALYHTDRSDRSDRPKPAESVPPQVERVDLPGQRYRDAASVGRELAGGVRVQALGVAVESDEVGFDTPLGELRDHGIERGDRTGVPDSGIRQVDLDPFDLDGVVVERMHQVVGRREEQLAADVVEALDVVGVHHARDRHDV